MPPIPTRNKRKLRQVRKAQKRYASLDPKKGNTNPFRHYVGKRVAKTNGRHAR